MEKPLPPFIEKRFTGMVANVDAVLRLGEVQLADNFFLKDGSWFPRLGVDSIGNGFASITAHVVQAVVEWSELAGTSHVNAFVDGRMFELDWPNQEWDEIFDLSTEGLTVSNTVPYHVIAYRGLLIGCDGVNDPWMYNPVGDVFTQLTNAPAGAGRVGVYFDKVFFWDIPGAPHDFEWSDEGDPVNGYAGALQSWTFVQSDSSPLNELAPLNDRLVVLKQDSVAVVYGAVEDDFQAAANRPAISDSDGSVAAAAVVIDNSDVYFLSRGGPRKVVGGERLENINEGRDATGALVDRLRDIWRDVDLEELPNALGAAHPFARQVWFAVPMQGDSGDRKLVLVYHADDDAWSALSFPWDIQVMLEVVNEGAGFSNEVECMILGFEGNNGVSIPLSGIIGYTATTADSTSGSAGVATEYTLRSQLYGIDTPQLTKRLNSLRLTLDLGITTSGPGPVTGTTGTVSYHTLGRELESGAGEPRNISTVAGGIAFTKADHVGRFEHRRGFNLVADAAGWQFFYDTDSSIGSFPPVVRAAVTEMSIVGTK